MERNTLSKQHLNILASQNGVSAISFDHRDLWHVQDFERAVRESYSDMADKTEQFRIDRYVKHYDSL